MKLKKRLSIAAAAGILIAGVSGSLGSIASAAPVAYTIDAAHSSVVFKLNHVGFSKTVGFFKDINGKIMFDAENPAASSVSADIKSGSVDTNSEKRDAWIKSEKVLDEAAFPTFKFTSTSITQTGDNTAQITGDLSMHGVTLPVVLDAVLNKSGTNPIAKRETIGFSATASLKRSDFGVSAFVGPLGDEVTIEIEIEAFQ